MTDVLNVRRNAKDLTASEELRGVSKVICWIDDENFLAAGDDTGYTMEISCPWASQSIVDAMLNRVRGYRYQPYNAVAAALDPAAELGDAVNIGGVYGGIYSQDTAFSGAMRSDISAPLDMEVDHEYRYEPISDRKYSRKFADLKASINVTAAQITAEVEARTLAEEQLSSRITQNASAITAKVSSTGGSASSFGWSLTNSGFTLSANGQTVFSCDRSGAEVKGKITATSGSIGPWSIGSDAIRYGEAEHGGIYFGIGGLYMGNNLVIGSDGIIHAVGADLTGMLTIGGATITAADLRAGAQSAVNNGGYWSGGSGWGFNFQNASIQNTENYQGYFRAGVVSAVNQIVTNGTLYAGQIYTGSHFLSLITKTINGVTINYLGYN